MRFTLRDIFDFISNRWNLDKKDIAKNYVHYEKTKLSRIFYLDDKKELEKIFNIFFDLTNKNSMAALYDEEGPKLLTDLQRTIEKATCRSEFEDIWEKEYDVFVKEMLRRANIKPPRKKKRVPEPTSEELTEQMRGIFLKAFAECDGYSLVHHPNRYAQEKIDRFVKIIGDEIECSSDLHRKEEIYSKIVEFTKIFDIYARSLTNDDYSQGLFSDYSAYRSSFDYDYRRLSILYREITGGTLFPIIDTIVVPEDCDEAVKAFFLLGQTASPVETVDASDDKTKSST